MAEATAERRQVEKASVRLIRGDITLLDVDAIVFYARPDLALGSGFGSAISVRGGPGIKEELQGKGPLAMGEAVVTSGGKLKARHIVHTVGPSFQEDDLEGKLRAAVRSALKRAEEKGVRRIAFPAMGAGFYGVPLDLCARAMVETIREHLKAGGPIEEVILCVLDSREYKPFKAQMDSLR